MTISGISGLSGLSGIIGPAGGGDPPTVFTLTFSNLSRFDSSGTNSQSFVLGLTDSIVGAVTTGSIYFDSSDPLGIIRTVEQLATEVFNALESLDASFVGKVSTVGAVVGVGSDYQITISFDASLLVTGMTVGGQFYPSITLTEAVAQQGVDDFAGIDAIYTLTCTAPNTNDSQYETVVLNPSGQVIFTDDSLLIDSVTEPTGWSITAGGIGSDFVTFSQSNAAVSLSIASQSGDGTYSLTEDQAGADPVTGQPEIHTITPTPVAPTGGTWKPYTGGSAIAHNANEAAITAETAGSEFSSASVTGTLDAGMVSVDNGLNGVISDTALSPVNVDLTAPEITHSIS